VIAELHKQVAGGLHGSMRRSGSRSRRPRAPGVSRARRRSVRRAASGTRCPHAQSPPRGCPLACAVRNCFHVGPDRRGAGLMSAVLRICCGLYAGEGNSADAAFSCAAAIPVVGDIAAGVKLGKAGAKAVQSAPSPPPTPKLGCAPNRFVPGTPVLMADGTHKRMHSAQATDPPSAATPPPAPRPPSSACSRPTTARSAPVWRPAQAHRDCSSRPADPPVRSSSTPPPQSTTRPTRPM
jgi:hypothetical protein